MRYEVKRPVTSWIVYHVDAPDPEQALVLLKERLEEEKTMVCTDRSRALVRYHGKQGDGEDEWCDDSDYTGEWAVQPLKMEDHLSDYHLDALKGGVEKVLVSLYRHGGVYCWVRPQWNPKGCAKTVRRTFDALASLQLVTVSYEEHKDDYGSPAPTYRINTKGIETVVAILSRKKKE